MTERAEIERLLQKTGRTLEGLPVFYPEDQQQKLYREVTEKRELWENRVLHQCDVIELLIDALRDALDDNATEISDADFEAFSKKAREVAWRKSKM